METKNNPIIADSSGVISLLVDSDEKHQRAAEIAKLLKDDPAPILVPSEVLAETLNTFGKKFGHQFASESMENLLESTGWVVMASSDVARRDALKLLKAVPAGVSYTDCLVMAIAEEYGTVEIFGFDDIFSKRGYSLPAGKRRAA